MKLDETDIQDSEGRVVISPGLKVRHKKSQYEYTVDSVVKDDDDSHVVVLRLPDEPRIDVTPDQDELLSDLKSKSVIYEVDPDLMIYEPDLPHDDDPEPGVDFLAVSEDEFEKD